MADTNVGNPNEGGGGGSEPTPEQIKANRLALLDKFEVEAARQAQRTPDGGDSGGSADDDDDAIDLTGLEPAVAASIRRKLKDADRRSRHVSTLAEFGLEQAQRAKALELAMEFNLDKDEIVRVQKALGSARTPDAVDLAARELSIRLREDGSVTVVRPKAEAKSSPSGESPDGGNPPPVDQGRGSGSNRTAALLEQIDAIDPSDPEADVKLEKLRREVDAAQKRHLERAARR